MQDDRIKKWRMILGKPSDPENAVNLQGGEGDMNEGMDDVLDALYDSDRQGGLGKSTPNINRWLGDIRKYFPTPVVQVMQKDALDNLGLDQMLLEPELLESVEPDVGLVGTLLSLNKVMPLQTKETAHMVVKKVVDALEKKLANPMRQAIEGTINRSVRNRRPKLNEIDWHKTIRRNLKHYQPEFKTVIPETLIGFGRKNGQITKEIILLVDQSGSMASSVVYASVFGAVMASLRSVKTQMVVFDTAVVDLTKELKDPVELLFGTQLGGGTDINLALQYAEGLITRPADTILVLISDLYEGGNVSEMLRRSKAIKESGTQIIALLALSDEGAPMFDKDIANRYGAMDIPTFACTPEQFPDLMAAAIKQEDLNNWMARNGIVGK